MTCTMQKRKKILPPNKPKAANINKEQGASPAPCMVIY